MARKDQEDSRKALGGADSGERLRGGGALPGASGEKVRRGDRKACEYGTLCTKKGQSENDRIPTALFCVTVLFLFIFDCLIDTNASDYNKSNR